MSVILTILFSFIAGFALAWFLRTIALEKIKKLHKSAEGFLESERLVKETLRKENMLAFQMKERVEAELGNKLAEAEKLIKTMDEDILLLQKNNEENEALFKAGEPELYSLKVQLIEAHNTISRLKGQLQHTKTDK